MAGTARGGCFPAAGPAGPHCHGNRGSALIITLVLLVVIGVTSVMSMRVALFGSLVGQNLRAHGLAMEAAELGLRHCEERVALNPAATPMMAGDGGAASGREWQSAANWTARAIVVPQTVAGGTLSTEQLPQCLIRMLTVDEYRAALTVTPGSETVEDRGIAPEQVALYRITARGYSPDFRRDDDGRAIAGAEVWLQSMIRAIE